MNRGRSKWLASVAVALTALTANVAVTDVQAATTVSVTRKVAVLVPDDLAPDAVGLKAWLDAAAEEGYEVSRVTDAEFLAMGAQASARLAGLIVPDGIHVKASDALVAALSSYSQAGGHLMVVFDAASLTETGFFAVPRSRLSELVGVDYILYDELRDRTVGLGPVKGPVSVLREMQVPPGKSVPLPAEVDASVAAYIPANEADPGALSKFDAGRSHRDAARQAELSALFGLLTDLRQRLGMSALTQQPLARLLKPVSNVTAAAGADFSTNHQISGYGYGPLTYPSYVTRGNYSGLSLLTSEQHGLVAGRRTVGRGDVTFINMPLTYLKLGTDGMPMHGSLHYFLGKVVKAPRLLSVPNGRAGITLNWHLDSNLALKPMQQLERMGVWLNGPFSLHMTAGPDTIDFGDGIGFDLPHNAEAQRFLRLFKLLGHKLGSHGGWIHDYYGHNVGDNNRAEFEPLLARNRQAVDAIVGRTAEYSAPLGNNPQWTVDWNEQQGVKSLYFLGHTGMGATRFWRDGGLQNPGMWAIPVTPFGSSATFEEFQEKGLTPDEVLNWYKDLVDFDIKYRTSRMVYMHPPGAMMYPTVVTDFLTYVRYAKWAGKIQWYTFSDLAAFMSSRQQVSWSTTGLSNGGIRLDASHPAGLSKMTWTLPKDAYQRPSVVSGLATVDDDDTHWLVRAWDVRNLSITAAPALTTRY